MKHRLVLRAGIVVCFVPVFAWSGLTAQEPAGRQGGGVQVGVPQGRQGGPGPGRQGGPGRQAGPPPKPTPRSADGRVLLGGATPGEKGVWQPGNGFGVTAATELATVPFQPWAREVYSDRQRNQL